MGADTDCKPSKLSPAAERVLKKAHRSGRVFASGGFGPDYNEIEFAPGQTDIENDYCFDRDERNVRDDPNFDTPGMISRLLRVGLLCHGERYNSFSLTDAGLLALIEHDLGRPTRRRADT